MGGESREREISLRSGMQVLSQLDPTKYDALGISINAEGLWAFQKPGSLSQNPDDLEGWISPGRAIDMLQMMKVDVVFPALHGNFGEDGTVQGMMELHHIAYVGSRVMSSALAMDKVLTLALLRQEGIPTPNGIALHSADWEKDGLAGVNKKLQGKVSEPWFVKPAANGSSVGVCRAENESELSAAIEQALSFGPQILIEEFCPGLETTCAVLGNWDGALQTLPPVEILPRKESFFTYEEKYAADGALEICPPKSLSAATVLKMQELARRSHQTLRCDGMSRVDMIVQGEKITVLEINTIPGLTERSLLPKAAAAAGISFPALLDRLIELALLRFPRRSIALPVLS